MNRRYVRTNLPRLLSVLLSILALAALLSACGGPAAPAGGQAAATQAPATTAPAAEAPTEAPTAEVAAATDAPTEAPAATAAPTEAPTEAPAANEAVSFSKDVMPIFEQTCIKCHGGSDGTKGDLDLTTHANTMKGGKDGAVVVPGDAANSMLVKLIENGKMPRRAPKLPQEQIDLIAKWVNEGAQDN
jgi:hypothetical protein